MFELWARKRPVNGVGHPYEFINSFEHESAMFSEVDKLDKSIYQEAIVTDGNGGSRFYREFPKPYVKSLGSNITKK